MALHIEELGVLIRVATGESLAGMASAVYKVKKPDGTQVDWAASVDGDEVDGNLKFATISGSLDQAGKYKLHAEVTYNSGAVLIGDKAEFEVLPLYHND